MNPNMSHVESASIVNEGYELSLHLSRAIEVPNIEDELVSAIEEEK